MSTQTPTRDQALVATYLLKLFSREKLAKAGLLDRVPDAALRRELSELSIEFFARYYLGEHLTRALSPIHLQVFAHLTKLISARGRAGSVLVMPRGFGKTTLVTLVFPLWATCLRLRRHIPIISDSFDQAKEQLDTLKQELEHNDRLKEDFGDLKGPKWQEAEIETANQVKLLALGARMKIRGRKYGRHRPDLIILDDIENLKGVQSAAQREALYAWFTRDVMRCGWDDTKVLVVGNFLHHDCLLARLHQNPMFGHQVYKALVRWPERMDLWDQWKSLITNLGDEHKDRTARAFYEANKAEMDRGGLSAWPEAFPLYDLMTIWVSEGETSFATELQNNPTDPSKRLLKHWGTYRKVWQGGEVWLVPSNGRPAVPLSSCAVFGYTDPSLGKSVKADYSAIVLIAKAPTRQQFVLEADIQRRPPALIMSDQVKWAKEYAIMRWGIESVQFQAMFATESALKSMEQGVYLPVMPISTLANKEMRIKTLEPDLSNEYLLLCEDGQDLLKRQLEEFPAGAYDDGPDALEGARTLAREWEPCSGTELVQGDAHKFSTRPGSREPSRGIKPVDEYEKYDKAHLEALRRELTRAEIDKDQDTYEHLARQLQAAEEAEAVFVPTTFI